MDRVTSLKKEPYRLSQPADMLGDLVHHGVLTEWLDDDDLWIPTKTRQADIKPVMFSPSEGLYSILTRVKGGDRVISRHRHFGSVHALVLKGRWCYLEHDWVAEEGSFAFEPPGETHTLYVPEGVEEMITLFIVRGGYVRVDVDGNAVGYEDVFTRIEQARNFYKEKGLGDHYVSKFIR